MKIKYYFKRIFNNRLKLSITLLLIIYPIIDFFMILLDVQRGASVPIANMASFLTSSIYNVCQILLLWYLPLYLLLIVADDCIEDYKIGYKNILVSKFGKKKYLFTNIIKGFIIGFSVIFSSLMINLIMTQITFAGGTYNVYDADTVNTIDNLRSALEHPLLTNIVYIFIASFISGIVGVGAVSLSIAIHSRIVVYPATFILWYIPTSIFERSIILALQPFTEYSILDAMHSFLFALFINLAAVIFAYIKETKYENL